MMRLGVAGESESDVAKVTALADRLVEEGVDWIDPEVIDAFRRWCGLGDSAWVDLHKVQRLARRKGLRLYGHFDGEPGALDASMHRALLVLFALESTPPSVVVVARDIDGQDERRAGFEQALGERTWPFEVVGALAAPEIEAWLIAAWTPETAADHAALKEVRAQLGFDPTSSPERLTSGKRTDKKETKRILDLLCATGRSAEERWEDTPLDERLLSAGRRCGLADFVDGIRDKLLPLLR